MRKSLAAIGPVLGIVVAAAVSTATPASAGTIPSNGGNAACGVQICLAYNSYGVGGWWTSDASEWGDLGGQTFRQGPTSNGGAGVGLGVKNNAAWVANGSAQRGVYLYVNSSRYGWGASDYVAPLGSGNLKGMVTYNNEAAYSVNSY